MQTDWQYQSRTLLQYDTSYLCWSISHLWTLQAWSMVHTSTWMQTPTQGHKRASSVNIPCVFTHASVIVITASPQGGDLNPIRAWHCNGHSSKQTWHLWRNIYCGTLHTERIKEKQRWWDVQPFNCTRTGTNHCHCSKVFVYLVNNQQIYVLRKLYHIQQKSFSSLNHWVELW